MKNMKRSLVALFALISTSSMAGLVQPTVNLSEDAPFRMSIGFKGGMKGVLNDKMEEANGMGNLGMGFGFVHNVGSDFEYGLSASLERSSLTSVNLKPVSIFDDSAAAKMMIGPRIQAALMARYMPEIAEGFRLGAFLELGVGRQLKVGDDGKKLLEDFHKSFGPVDGSVKVGPALNYSFTDSVAVYAAPHLAMTNIRFGGDATDKEKKEENNHLGVGLPFGAWFAASDMFGIFVELEPRLANFKQKDKDGKENMMKSFQGEATLGFTF